MLPPLYKYPVTFATLGWIVADWIQTYLVHGPGDIQGDSITLDDEELAWLAWAYRLNPADGRRFVHRAVYCRAKGCRKSEFAGMVACAEALGPVRFDSWLSNGEPVGRPVTSPFIRIMATEEGQSSNVYDNVSYMLSEGPVANYYDYDVGRSFQSSSRIFIKSGGAIVPSTSGNASKDGGKESFCVSDETHLMVSDKLRGMYRTVARNTTKRMKAEPWMMEATTSWQPGEDSIAEQVAQDYKGMDYEEAVIKHGVLFDMRQGEPPSVFNRDDSLKKAIRSAYGPFKASWTDFDKVVRVIRDAEDPEQEAFRYYLNIPRAGHSQWLYPEEVSRVAGEVHPEPNEAIAIGFDGSAMDDHTVLMGCRENGDLFTIGYWTPSLDQQGWRQEVHDAIHWTFDTYTVVRAYFDPPYWSEELLSWERRYGSPPIVEFWTNKDQQMGAATGVLRTAIRKEDPDERITIDTFPLKTPEVFRDGKTLVEWHFCNARTRKVRVRLDDKSEEAFIVRKDRPGSAHKIDSVPSAVLARRARDDAVSQGEFEVPDYGIYNF